MHRSARLTEGDSVHAWDGTVAVVRFDGSGKVCVFNKSAAHLVVDLQGYFVEGSFDDVVDERLLDTRNRWTFVGRTSDRALRS